MDWVNTIQSRPECVSSGACPVPDEFFKLSEFTDYHTGIGIPIFLIENIYTHSDYSENENLTKYWTSDWKDSLTPNFTDRTFLFCERPNFLMGLIEGNNKGTRDF